MLHALLDLVKAIKDDQEWLDPDIEDCLANAAESFDEALCYLSLASEYAGSIATDLADDGLQSLATTFKQVEADLDALSLALQGGADPRAAIAQLEVIMQPLQPLIKQQADMAAALLEQWEGTLG